jgi:hypothetical protein
MPFRPDAEQNEVEPGGKLRVPRPEGVDLLFRDADAREERLAGEALVRVLVVGRDEPLVTPPDVPRAPIDRDAREALIDGSDRRAAGEGDPEGEGPARPLRDPGSGELR